MQGSTEILSEVFDDLKGTLQGCTRGIRTIALGTYFTVVELDEGSVGAAMSYYKCSHQCLRDGSARLIDVAATDPLLEGLFSDSCPEHLLPAGLAEQEEMVLMSLLTAVVNALSSPVIDAGGDETFFAGSSLPFDPCFGVRSAVVLGYGGYLLKLARNEGVKHLHIADPKHPIPDMKAELEQQENRAAEQLVTFSDGSDTRERLKGADLACITGSALCNGTMEAALDAARRCPRVIVQGQSASIYPRALFRRGVDLVETSVKPNELIDCATADQSGRLLKPHLEGDLESVYLLST